MGFDCESSSLIVVQSLNQGMMQRARELTRLCSTA